jgi:hypothetical protein
LTASWVDLVVIIALGITAIAFIAFFISAKRPRSWIVRWGLWGLLFFVFEIWGAQSGNTLSENIISSVPLWLVIAATWVGAGILTIHWLDLKDRLSRGKHANR